jgi:signal transduction histidine kinase/ligand-binding sensor domain-containing protein
MVNPFLRNLGLVLIATVLAMPAGADETTRPGGSSYAVTAWSADAGLPAPLDTVFALAQDRVGYLWLGTRSGLVRFDGSQFFPWGSRGEPALPGRSVRALASAKDGSLWVSFADASGITRIKDEKVVVYSERDGLAEGGYSAILEDRRGRVWAAGRRGLAHYDGERWHTSRTGIESGEIFSIYEDRGGRLWVGTSEGVFRQSQSGGAFEAVDRAIHAESLAESASGTMWATDSRSIVRSVGSAEPLTYAQGLPAPAAGWRLITDRHGVVWIAALGNGLLRLRTDPDTGTHVLEPYRSSRLRGSVQSLFLDNEGNLWVGMRNGIVRLSQSFVDIETSLEGLTEEGVRALTVADDGSVWAATTYGLNRFEGTRRTVYDHQQTMALHADRSGALWFATTQGVSRFSRGSFSQMADVSLDRVVAMTTDRDGRLWVCSGAQGVFQLSGRQLARVESGLPQKPCSTVYSDRASRVWVGFTTGGVAVLDGATWRAYSEKEGLATGRVNGVREDRAGAVWISTVSGLSRLMANRITTADQRHGMPEQLERSFVEDDEGYFWFIVNGGSGLVRIDGREMDKIASDPAHKIRYHMYDKSDGFPSGLPFWNPSAVRDRSGKLWFATGEGLAIIDVGSLPTEKSPVVPRIEKLVADGITVPATSSLQLPTSTSTLQIDYAALSLTAGTKLRFRYMLEGADSDEWVYAGARRQASFSNVQPGAYTFRVSATSDGNWTEPEAVWAFSVPPPFYRTTPFYALFVTLLASTIGAYWWMSMRAVRNKYALVLAERARVSREIHDTLLQSLGAISIELEVVNNYLGAPEQAGSAIQRLRGQIQKCVTDARVSIWELRSPGLETRNLADALRDLADNTNWGRAIDVSVSSNGRSRPCSPNSQEQLMRIAREAMSNAAKHGQANKIDVTIVYKRRRVTMRIVDDGIGFVQEVKSRNGSHCGLASMAERAERVGGRLTVTSKVGAGAVVEAEVPVS